MWDDVEICAGGALWHDHKTMGLGHVCSLDTIALSLTFHSDSKVQGRVTQVQPRKRVYQLGRSPTKYSYVVPAAISTWAGTTWHGLPNTKPVTGKLGNACI